MGKARAEGFVEKARGAGRADEVSWEEAELARWMGAEMEAEAEGGTDFREAFLSKGQGKVGKRALEMTILSATEAEKKSTSLLLSCRVEPGTTGVIMQTQIELWASGEARAISFLR